MKDKKKSKLNSEEKKEIKQTQPNPFQTNLKEFWIFWPFRSFFVKSFRIQIISKTLQTENAEQLELPRTKSLLLQLRQ